MTIRPIRIEGDVAYITLTKGYVAIIDAADVPLVEGYNWYAHCSYRADRSLRAVYVVRARKSRLILIHRQIMLPPDNMDIDHIDSDGLNNRRENMRIATRQQNSFNQRKPINNTSGFMGVSWISRDRKWQASIAIDGRLKNLGLFTCVHAAAAARAAASDKYYGEWGRVE